VEEHLPNIHKALSSVPNIAKKKRKERKRYVFSKRVKKNLKRLSKGMKKLHLFTTT
jgi:hypothetical protein